MSTSARVFFGSVVVLAFVMALFAMMNYLKFEGVLSGLLQSRRETTALSVAEVLQGAMKDGLALSKVPNVDALLKQARLADPAIDQLDVFDSEGARLFTTSKQTVIEGSISKAILEAHRSSTARAWKIETDDTFIAGARILDRSGRTAGGVALTQPTEAFQQQLSRFASSLTRRTTVVFLGGTVVLFFGVWIGSRELRRLLAALRVAHQRLEQLDAGNANASRSAGTEPREASAGWMPLQGADLGATVETIAGHYADASASIARYERGMTALPSSRGRAMATEESLTAVRQRSGARSIEELRDAMGAWVEQRLTEDASEDQRAGRIAREARPEDRQP